ncbi:hypothetical protein D3C72_2015160 [compost metagenome]
MPCITSISLDVKASSRALSDGIMRYMMPPSLGLPRKYASLASSFTYCWVTCSPKANGPVPMGPAPNLSPSFSAAFLLTMLPP